MDRENVKKREVVVLKRQYDSALTVLLMVVGIIIAILGLILLAVLMAEAEDPSGIVFIVFGVVMIIVGHWLKAHCAINLTVTNMRVSQDGPFGSFVDLPISQITAVSGNAKTLNIVAYGVRITLTNVTDSDTVRNVVVGLLKQIQPDANDVVAAETGKLSMLAEEKAQQEDNQKFWACECGMKNAEHAAACKGCGKSRTRATTNGNSTVYKKCACGAQVKQGEKCPICGKMVY